MERQQYKSKKASETIERTLKSKFDRKQSQKEYEAERLEFNNWSNNLSEKKRIEMIEKDLKKKDLVSIVRVTFINLFNMNIDIWLLK